MGNETASRVQVIDAATLMVDLGSSLILPFEGAKFKENRSSGWARVEKRAEGVYVDGVKMVLHLHERQKEGGRIYGAEVLEAFASTKNAHPNVLDASTKYDLLPDDFKYNESGIPRHICTFEVVYQCGVQQCVRCWTWRGDLNRWVTGYKWLEYLWGSNFPGVVLKG